MHISIRGRVTIMLEQTRRRLAFLIAVKKGFTPGTIYSFARDSHTRIDIGPKTMFDWSTRTHFTDEYDYGQKAHWQLKLDRDEFEGFDYASQQHFSGFVSGRSIQIYDRGEDRYFDYAV
jgi:hypothetical protein